MKKPNTILTAEEVEQAIYDNRSEGVRLRKFCQNHADMLKRGVERGFLSQKKIDDALSYIEEDER